MELGNKGQSEMEDLHRTYMSAALLLRSWSSPGPGSTPGPDSGPGAGSGPGPDSGPGPGSGPGPSSGSGSTPR